MKRLVLIDHLGEIQFEATVYMEGEDFKHSEPTPKPIWLQYIMITDLNTKPPLEKLKKAEQEVIPHDEEAHSLLEKRISPVFVWCFQCGWDGSTLDCAHDEDTFSCPDCGSKYLRPQDIY
ncbi:hypothetical protein LCGC14_2566740, partial [marine sediment metagenome]